MIMKKPITVKQLSDRLNELVEEGDGELKVYIYEAVFGPYPVLESDLVPKDIILKPFDKEKTKVLVFGGG